MTDNGKTITEGFLPIPQLQTRFVIDPGMAVIRELRIQLHANGDISCFGLVKNEKNQTIDLLRHVIREIKESFHLLEEGKHVVIPQRDTSIVRPRHYGLSLDTADFNATAPNL